MNDAINSGYVFEHKPVALMVEPWKSSDKLSHNSVTKLCVYCKKVKKFRAAAKKAHNYSRYNGICAYMWYRVTGFFFFALSNNLYSKISESKIAIDKKKILFKRGLGVYVIPSVGTIKFLRLRYAFVISKFSFHGFYERKYNKNCKKRIVSDRKILTLDTLLS